MKGSCCCGIGTLFSFFLSRTMFVSRDGIRFAFQDPEEGEEQYRNVPFLEILSEFSFKVLQDDRSKLWETETWKATSHNPFHLILKYISTHF